MNKGKLKKQFRHWVNLQKTNRERIMTNKAKIAELENKIKALDSSIADLQNERKQHSFELGKIKSLAFIAQHNICINDVHNLDAENWYGYKDNEDTQRWVVGNVTKPWIAYNGKIYETKPIKAGGWVYDQQSDGLYKDLLHASKNRQG